MKLIYTIHKADVCMFTWLNTVRIHATLAHLARKLTKTGDGPLYVLLAAWFCWLEGVQSPLARGIALAFMIERPLYFVLKNSLKRNRPQAALENFRSIITPSDQFSFPSGHTSAAFMMATLLSYFYPALFVWLFAWAGTVGFSRIVLGVHFPTDILVGALLGIITAIISLEYILK